MGRRGFLLIGSLLLLVVGGLAAFLLWPDDGAAQIEGAEVTTLQVGGENAVAVAADEDGARPLVVFAHGVDGDEWTPLEPRLVAFTQALVDDGAVVVASAAHGAAWGSPESQRAYIDLIDWARRTYDVSGVVLVGESMGAVPTLNLVASGQITDLRGWVGVNPVTNLEAMAADDRFTDSVEAALSDDEVHRLDPMAIDPARLGGVPLVIHASDEDVVTPPAEQLDPFVAHMPAVTVVECSGGHVAPDCFRPEAVLQLGS